MGKSYANSSNFILFLKGAYKMEEQVVMKFPEVRAFIVKYMKKARIQTNVELMKRINKITPMGHEFVRQIVNGNALPEVENAKAMALALGAEPVEFLCIIENCRLKFRKLSGVLKVVKIRKKKGE
jgi:hypothetical protein